MKRQIAIEIDDDYYRDIMNAKALGEDLLTLEKAVADGTPLPKGHGRLIDADAFIKFLRHKEYGMIDYSDCVIDDITENASTIIEADKERE